MLKLGTLRWKGKCGRHPAYDPADGEGAIRGGCARCYALLDIFRQHRQLMEAIRAYGPPREPRRRATPDLPQMNLFE